MDLPALPRAPSDALGPTGPRLGAYAGSLGRVDLSPLTPTGLVASVRFGARLRRWHRAVLATGTHLVVVSVLDGGAVAGGSIWAVERASGEVLFDRVASGVSGLTARVGPHPGAGARSAFTGPGMALSLERRSDRYQLEADLGSSLALSARLDARGAPEPFALVAPLPEEGVRTVQVTGPLGAEGTLSVRGRSYPLGDALAALDFGVGLFPREVAWRKLGAVGRLADGRAVALQLAEGLEGVVAGDGGEDVLLLGAGPTRLPPVVFEADPQSPTAAWRVASLDGAVDLTFRPRASHQEARTLLVVSTRATLLCGEVSGRVPGPDGAPLELAGLPALVEDLQARW